MTRKELPLARDTKFLSSNLAFSLLFIVFAVYKGYDGSVFYAGFWGFCALVALFYSLMMTNTKCAECGTVLKLDAGLSQFLRCAKCGTYIEVEKGKAFTVDEDRVAEAPAFAVAVGGPGDDNLNPAGIAAASVVTPTADGGQKRLDFRFPEGCCVCGKPHTERQSITFDAVGKGAKALGFVDERLTFVVEGLPHCEDHRNGATLAIENLKLVLKFRSLTYRNAFRKLNGLS